MTQITLYFYYSANKFNFVLSCDGCNDVLIMSHYLSMSQVECHMVCITYDFEHWSIRFNKMTQSLVTRSVPFSALITRHQFASWFITWSSWLRDASPPRTMNHECIRFQSCPSDKRSDPNKSDTFELQKCTYRYFCTPTGFLTLWNKVNRR